MRMRMTLSDLALSLLGAGVVTAGALLLQYARRPVPRGPTGAPTPGSTAHDSLHARGADVRPKRLSFGKDDNLLRRLREHGL